MQSIWTVINVKVLYGVLNTYFIFFSGAIASVLAIWINYNFEERLDIEKLDDKGLIKWGNLKNGQISKKTEPTDDSDAEFQK